jgi:hypothetical protein
MAKALSSGCRERVAADHSADLRGAFWPPWGTPGNGAIIRGDDPTLTNAWDECTSFLGYDSEIRHMSCSTNAIESLNARHRRAIHARGHPTGTGRARWTMCWKPVINTFAITFQ